MNNPPEYTPPDLPLRRVIIESPFRGANADERRQNTRYARAALRDSLKRNEAPIASHLLLPQVLDEDVDADRNLGISAGLAWYPAAEAVCFYLDRGMSFGMHHALRQAIAARLAVEMRYLYGVKNERQGGGNVPPANETEISGGYTAKTPDRSDAISDAPTPSDQRDPFQEI